MALGKPQESIERLKQEVMAKEQEVMHNEANAEALFDLGITHRKLAKQQLQIENREEAIFSYINAISAIDHAVRLKLNKCVWSYELARSYDEADSCQLDFEIPGGTKFELAVKNYKKAISLKTNYRQAYLSLGLLYYRKGKYPQAIDNFYEVLKIDPSNETAYTNIFECIKKQKNKADAVENLDRLKKIIPDKAEPYLLVSDIRRNNGNLEASLVELETAKELEPGNEIIEQKITNTKNQIEVDSKVNDSFSKGESALNRNQYGRAIGYFDEILKIKPDHIEARNMLEESRSKYSDYWFKKGARNSDFKKLNDKDLKNKVQNFNNALKYAEGKNQIDKILEKWQGVQGELGERGMIYRIDSTGAKYFQNGELDKAINYLIVAYDNKNKPVEIKVKLDSLDKLTLYNKGLEKEKEGDWVGALNKYNQLYKIDPNFMDLKFRMWKVKGDSAYSAKQWNLAIDRYGKAIKIDSVKSKKSDTPHNTSLFQRYIEANEKISNKNVFKIIVWGIVCLVCLAGLAIFIYRNRKKIIEKSRIDFIKKIWERSKFALSVFIILSLLVIFWGSDLYHALLLIDENIRALIYTVIFAVVLISILTFIPIKIVTSFNIISKYISFLYFPKRNPNESLFKSVVDVQSLNLVDITRLDLSAMKLVEIATANPLIYDNDIIIKPWDETTDLNVLVKVNDSNSLLKIHNLSLKYSKLELGFNYDKETLKIFLVNYKNEKNYNILELSPKLQIILSKCHIFNKENELLKSIETKKSFNYISADTKKAIIKFSIGNGSSKIEIKSPTIVDKKTNNLIEGLSVKKLDFIDRAELTDENEISSVLSGTIKVVLRKMKPHNLKENDCIVFSPNIIKSLQIKLNSEGINSIYKAKLRTLKYGEKITIDDSSNEIPKFTEWLIEHNKPLAIAILFTGWIIVLIIQPYLENLFGKLFFD